MDNRKKQANIAHSVDPQAPRTPEAMLGIDDIGLPEDIVPEDARKPEQIEPEADRIAGNLMKGKP